jgi:hypothetical protein
MFLVDHHSSISEQTAFAGNNPFVPVVPPPARMIDDGGIFENGITIDMDGMNISNSMFRNGVVFKYGGGAFKLTNTFMDGTQQIELVGAAANTVAFLQQVGAIVPAKPDNIVPNTPITRTVERKKIQNTLLSPY